MLNMVLLVTAVTGVWLPVSGLGSRERSIYSARPADLLDIRRVNISREALLNRRLKEVLVRHGCRVASGVETLHDGTQVTPESNVELDKAKIHSPVLEVGVYTGMISDCEFPEIASTGCFCSIATGVATGQLRRSRPIHWLNIHAFTANPKLSCKPSQPKHKAVPARIDHNAWIERGVLILDGVETGTGAAIGAQSLVNRDMPPYAVVVDSPAWVLRYRFASELVERLLASRWWELSLDVLGELPLDGPQACVETLERRPPQARQEAWHLRVRHKPFAIEWLS